MKDGCLTVLAVLGAFAVCGILALFGVDIGGLIRIIRDGLIILVGIGIFVPVGFLISPILLKIARTEVPNTVGGLLGMSVLTAIVLYFISRLFGIQLF